MEQMPTQKATEQSEKKSSKQKSSQKKKKKIKRRQTVGRPPNVSFEKLRGDKKAGSHRVWIVARLKNGKLVYWVDDVVRWSVCKYAGMQIYGAPYAEKYIQSNILTIEPVALGEKPLKNVTTKPVSPKYVDARYYMENVLGKQYHFTRAKSIKKTYDRKLREKKRKRETKGKTDKGNGGNGIETVEQND